MENFDTFDTHFLLDPRIVRCLVAFFIPSIFQKNLYYEKISFLEEKNSKMKFPKNVSFSSP